MSQKRVQRELNKNSIRVINKIIKLLHALNYMGNIIFHFNDMQIKSAFG